MSDTLQLDVNDLTIEEIEIIEDYINLPIDQCFSEGAKRCKTLRAFA